MNDIQKYYKAKELAELIFSGKVTRIYTGNRIISSRIQRCQLCSYQEKEKEECLGYFIETESGRFPNSGHCLCSKHFKRVEV